jgi:hypothetical protein
MQNAWNEKSVKKVWSEDLMGRDDSEDLGVDWSKLEWILRKENGTLWIGLNWLKMGPVTRCCEHDNEPSGFTTNGGEFLD